MGTVKRISFAGAICAALYLANFASAQKATQWVPTKSILEKLSAPTSIGAYEIRSPKGYEAKTREGGNGFKMTLWFGPQRANGTRAGLTLVVMPEPPTDVKPTLEELMRLALEDQKGLRTEWKVSPSERGDINGIRFMRAYWSGASRQYKQSLRGFIYVAQVGKRFVQIGGQDVEPYQKETLPLVEAATMTFKKRE